MNIKSESELKVLRHLFENPTTLFHLRELSRKANLNPNTVSTVLKKLQKEDFVAVRKNKHLTQISLKLENSKTIEWKRIFNLLNIYDSGLNEFLIKTFSPKSVSLVGSYSKGEDIEKSDVDIVVNTNIRRKVELEKFEKILKRNIHLLFYDKKMSDEFFNNLINGVVIYGVIRK